MNPDWHNTSALFEPREKEGAVGTYLHEAVFGPVPQSEPLDERQVANSAGGFVYEVDPAMRLRRFLVLGTEGGTYYARERKLTADAVKGVRDTIRLLGPEAVGIIRDVSVRGLAPKNDPALLALALASVDSNQATRRAAFDALPEVARIGTHLFQWASFREEVGGWGRGARRAVARWYEGKDPGALEYQLVKYRQRHGKTHRKMLRVSHPRAPTGQHRALYDFAVGRSVGTEDMRSVEGFVRLQDADPAGAAQIIHEYGLPREAVPTAYLTRPDVWDALLDTMPITAVIRNLATMTRVGLLTPLSSAVELVTGRLGDAERLRNGRVHPIQVLSALTTYTHGAGVRGGGTWEPVPAVSDALDAAFYLAFGAVEPAGKRTLLALDVSGSMGWGVIAGVPGLTPRVASAAMALVTAATEPKCHIVAFSHTMVKLPISPRGTIMDALNVTDHLPFGGTDCALPMQHALSTGIDVDTFVIYTDSETWRGGEHPVQALRRYRKATGINARLIVVGMTATEFTIADPRDPGMLDVVGFDASAPSLMSAFSRGSV